MKLLIMTLTIATCSFAFANSPMKEKKAELKAKMDEAKASVNQACAADAAKAGCSEKEIGQGLMKCLQAYNKEHKDFTISEGCKNSTKELREERKEVKKVHAEMKAARKAAKEAKKADEKK